MEAIRLMERQTHGEEAFDDEGRFVGYNNIETFFEAVPESQIDAYLERHSEEGCQIKTILPNLPQPFASGAETAAALKELLAVTCKMQMGPKVSGEEYQRFILALSAGDMAMAKAQQ